MPEDEVCGICRVQFDGTCPTCKFPGDDCTLCMSDIVSEELTLTVDSDGKMWSLISYALPGDLDPTRLLKGTMSYVSTE